MSQFFRSRRNSAARKAAPLTMIPAAMIAASQPEEFFLRRGAACPAGGRSRVQYRQTRAWAGICSLQNGQIRVRMVLTI